MTGRRTPVPKGYIRFGRTETGPLDIELRRLREKHFAVAGPTGQRKTLFLLSVLMQFIDLADDSCFFIDLGGDQAALWLLEKAARLAGKPFYFFSLDNRHNGCCWDPISGTPAYAADVTLASSGIASGFSLLHGEGYGRKFWGRINYKAITEAFDALLERIGRLPDFPEFVSELVRQGKRQRNTQQTSEAYLAAEHLLRYDALTGKGAKRLNIGQAIEEGAVVVFYIPSALRGEAARAVASMVLWSAMVEMASRTEEGKAARYLQLAVDEYAQVASSRSAVDSGLAMARKWNVALWAVYQDDAQLITPEGDLRSIIRSQCQRILFARESEEEIDELRNRSLDIVRPDKSQSLRGMSLTTSVRESLEPALERNDVMKRSGVAMDAYAVLRLGDKHRDPIPFTIIPPTASPDEHDRLKRKPLPRKPVTPQQDVPAYSAPTTLEAPHRDERRKKLQELYRQLRADQTWRLRSDRSPPEAP